MNSFEEHTKEAKRLLDELMNPEKSLEESMKVYQDGINHLKEAQKLLEEAETKIEIIEKKSE